MFGLTETDRARIVSTLEQCGVERAVLFGSRAKGNYRYNSDIDIAIFGKTASPGQVVLALDELPMPYKFDVVDYDSLQNDALRAHIDDEGQVLLEEMHAHGDSRKSWEEALLDE